MSDYLIDLNTYQITEEYRPTWDNALIHAISDPVANLQQYATRFIGEGEYVKFQTDKGGEIFRRTQRRQMLKTDPEILLGERYIYASLFFSHIGMSKDDLVLKGDLPVTFELCNTKMREKVGPVVDKAFLGVTFSETLGNCYIPDTTSKSPYHNVTVSSESQDGKLYSDQGLLGVAWVKNGSGTSAAPTAVALPQQPALGYGTGKPVAATTYADYDTAEEMQLNMKETAVIPVNYKADGTVLETGLTLDKLRAAKRAMMERGIINSMNTPLNMAVTHQQLEDLAQLPELQSILYGYQSIKDGVPMTIYGINLIVTEHVPVVNIGGDTPKWVRSCPVWVNDSVRFAEWGTPEGYFEKVPDSIDYYRYVLTFGLGCGRVREEGVVSVHCKEAALKVLDDANIKSV